MHGQIGIMMRDIIASGCKTPADLMTNIRGLSNALLALEGKNVSIQQIALDLAANAILLAQTDNTISLTAIKKITNNQRTLQIKAPSFLSDEPYKAGSAISQMRRYVRSELALAWKTYHGAELPDVVSTEFSITELKQIERNSSLFAEKGIDLNRAGILYKLCGRGSPVCVDERFRINWIVLNYDKINSN